MSDRPLRATHLQPRMLVLVFIGGTLGTAARELVSLVLTPGGGIPVATLVVNITGAFTLGILLEALARGGEDVGVRRSLRLFFGAGFLGGFTTYSALATDSVLLGEEPILAASYAIGTLVFGGIATWIGIVIASRVGRGDRR